MNQVYDQYCPVNSHKLAYQNTLVPDDHCTEKKSITLHKKLVRLKERFSAVFEANKILAPHVAKYYWHSHWEGIIIFLPRVSIGLNFFTAVRAMRKAHRFHEWNSLPWEINTPTSKALGIDSSNSRSLFLEDFSLQLSNSPNVEWPARWIAIWGPHPNSLMYAGTTLPPCDDTENCPLCNAWSIFGKGSEGVTKQLVECTNWKVTPQTTYSI